MTEVEHAMSVLVRGYARRRGIDLPEGALASPAEVLCVPCQRCGAAPGEVCEVERGCLAQQVLALACAEERGPR